MATYYYIAGSGELGKTAPKKTIVVKKKATPKPTGGDWKNSILNTGGKTTTTTTPTSSIIPSYQSIITVGKPKTPTKTPAKTTTKTPTKKRVTIEGTATLESYIKTVADVETQLRQDFKLWNVIDLQLFKVSSGISESQIQIRLIVDVNKTESLQSVKDRALKVIRNWTTISGARLSNVLLKATEKDVNFTGDVQPDTGGIAGNNSVLGGFSPFSQGDFLGNLGSSLGLSTPVVLLIGGVFLVLLLKR